MAVMNTNAGTQAVSVLDSSMPANPVGATTRCVSRPESEQILDQMFGDTPEVREEEAVRQMKRNPSASLTSAMIESLLSPVEVERLAETVLPHLCRDFWSRYTLRHALEFAKATPDHPAYALLSDADEWVRWNKAGRDAASTATERLKVAGIGAVYGRDGAVYRRYGDGAEEIVAEATPQ